MNLKERIKDFKVYANKLMESDFDLTLREALEFIKNQQEIIEEAKKALGNIVDENDNSCDDKESYERASENSYHYASKALVKINQMEQENDK
jgi:hypothetical protein